MRLFPPNSLKRRLVWQLLLLQAGMLLLLFGSLLGLFLRADLGGALPDAGIVEIVAAAAVRDGDGRLVLRDPPELQEIRAAAPGLWFILRSERGEVLTSGPVPDVYRALGGHLDRLTFADIRDATAPYALSALIRGGAGKDGELTVLAGGGRLVSLTYAMLIVSNLLMIPLLLLLALIAVVAIPWIIGRAFSGLSAVADQAEHIDIDRRGHRLPDSDVPAEVQPLVQAVNGALDRLDAGHERHRRFILDAAHELRTPVAILQTRIETMPHGALRTRLLADAGRIAGLAEQLLDLQRLSRTGEAFTRLDLVALCKRVAADLAPLAIASGYELSFDTTESEVVVMGEPGALERTIVNLVQNAIEHGGQKGGITIRVERGGVVEVSDEGPGVPPKEREQIFEPFHRVHPRERGAGLGLNLVREVVHRHGGYVTVVDTPMGGACFRLSLPAQDM